MASRNNLKRIGEEGFRMLEQAEEKQRCLYHPTKPTAHFLKPPLVTQVQILIAPPPQIQKPSNTMKHTLLNPIIENTTSRYNPPGCSADYMTHVTHATNRDQASVGVMDCYEAARRFGGMVVTDYYPNSKKVMMQRGNKAF